jgi:crotonobetainyl-CoA:carnitine CoA-transferase CaiB-like acyl-CoA transferase
MMALREQIPLQGAELPLAGLKVVERFGEGSTDTSRVAVSFAGLMARRFGCDVVRVEDVAGDPLRKWPPFVDGQSALHAFLNAGKTIAPVAELADDAFLLTDDPDIASAYVAGRTVLIQPGRAGDGKVWSELTLLGASGLLDIYGQPGFAPLPLPGHQLAYAAGTAAFSAMVAAAFNDAADAGRGEISILDVALWTNWKHFMAGILGTPKTGLAREEEWRTVKCADGYIAFTFQDKDVEKLSQLTGNSFFDDPALHNRRTRAAHLESFSRAVEDWVATRDRASIVAAASALRMPIGPVLRIEDLIDDAQFNAREFLVAADGRAIPRLPVHWQGRALGSNDELYASSVSGELNRTGVR